MKVIPSPKRTSSYKAHGGGEFLQGAVASDADSTVLNLDLVVTFPAKGNLSAFTQCLWAKGGEGERMRPGAKGFLLLIFFF